MNKFISILVFLLLFSGVNAGEEGGFPLVSGVCLLDSGVYKRNLPPGRIAVGLEVRSESLYKISARGRVLQAGVFPKGFQSFELDAAGFFDRTNSHSFLLECKSGEMVVKKEVTIDIRLLPLYIVQKKGEERKKHVFSLSFFIGDRMLYSTRKFPPSDISFKLDLPPSDGRYNPFGLIDGAQKPVSGIPIMGAVTGLYQLAKSLSPREKIQEEDTIPEKKQRIETTFLKRDMAGDLWQWRALISLKASDMDQDPVTIP